MMIRLHVDVQVPDGPESVENLQVLIANHGQVQVVVLDPALAVTTTGHMFGTLAGAIQVHT